MQTKNLIQHSANVIKITNIKKGDVFKVIDSQYSIKTLYGVVLDLFNTGENAFVQVLQYEKTYSSYNAEIKTYDGSKDLAIFPATIEDVREHLNGVIESQERDIKAKEKELQEKIESLNKAREFVSGEMSRKLSEMSFEEISQSEYNEKVIRKAIESSAL